jgi:F0F1-type ATP synthase epsilon subunit
VRRKRLLILGLALVLLTAVAGSATGCSLSEAKDKAALLAALTKFDLESAPLAVTVNATDNDAVVTSNGTPVATAIKDGLADVADEWQSVVDKAKKVDKADVEAAEEAWSNLEEAVASLPEDATAGEAGAIIGSELDELLTVRSQLTAVATGSE